MTYPELETLRLERVGPVVEVRLTVNQAVETALRDAGAAVPTPVLRRA